MNSYKRLTTGEGTTPEYATWGLRNRSAMIRIPIYKPGKQLSTRIELRSPDPMANPYLVNASNAGRLVLTASSANSSFRRRPPRLPCACPSASSSQAGYTQLPRNLEEALDIFEDSQFRKDALGRAYPQLLPYQEARGVEEIRFMRLAREVDRYLSTHKGQPKAYGACAAQIVSPYHM